MHDMQQKTTSHAKEQIIQAEEKSQLLKTHPERTLVTSLNKTLIKRKTLKARRQWTVWKVLLNYPPKLRFMYLVS